MTLINVKKDWNNNFQTCSGIRKGVVAASTVVVVVVVALAAASVRLPQRGTVQMELEAAAAVVAGLDDFFCHSNGTMDGNVRLIL